MQITVPEDINCVPGEGCPAGKFLTRVADAHNTTDNELERYKKENDAKTSLLFAKVDKIVWWIIGTAVLIIMAVLFKK